jgi:two-component system NtrC family sensor kinase
VPFGITSQKTLKWRIVIALLIVALLPLVIAGVGGWIVFGNLLEQKALEQMKTFVQGHANAIDNILSDRKHLLQLLSESYSLENLSDSDKLQNILHDLNQSSDGGFIDLGVIDMKGNHLTYSGPYELQDKNYRQADWFKEVMIGGIYISDVFLGYRQVPHFIIAIKCSKGDTLWILRATINSRQFDEQVRFSISDKIYDAYIINKEGLYQTTPKTGLLLDKSSIPIKNFYEDIDDHRVTQNDTTLIIVNSWVNNNRWILVVEQELTTILEPVNQAIANVAKIVLIAVILLIITTFFATRHLTNQIDKANKEKDEMSRAFMRSAKLASIGELATGLAHEINNPLAIISAEQTNISDLISELKAGESEQIFNSVDRCQAQVQRCASITRKMLQFGRKQESRPELTDIAPRVQDVISLLERHANVRNIKIESEIEDNLPEVLVDQIEFEQVLVNLINNAIDALPIGGKISIKVHKEKDRAHLVVQDNGIGIPPEVLERIFEPFYTTKPAGKGTGLGLSVCYGIVYSWGGRIKAESVQGEGTKIHVFLPLPT